MSCDPEECTDGELAALTLAGRKEAFATIVSRHRDAMYRLVKGYVGNSEEVADLVQDCFFSAYKRLDSFDQARPFRSWLARIALNKCRDWGRRRAVRRLLFSVGVAAVEETLLDPAPDPETAVADRQELDRLWNAISELPRNLKEPLILRTVDGFSEAEVAHVLRISEKAVETRVYRARRKLAALRDASG